MKIWKVSILREVVPIFCKPPKDELYAASMYLLGFYLTSDIKMIVPAKTMIPPAQCYRLDT